MVDSISTVKVVLNVQVARSADFTSEGALFEALDMMKYTSGGPSPYFRGTKGGNTTFFFDHALYDAIKQEGQEIIQQKKSYYQRLLCTYWDDLGIRSSLENNEKPILERRADGSAVVTAPYRRQYLEEIIRISDGRIPSLWQWRAYLANFGLFGYISEQEARMDLRSLGIPTPILLAIVFDPRYDSTIGLNRTTEGSSCTSATEPRGHKGNMTDKQILRSISRADKKGLVHNPGVILGARLRSEVKRANPLLEVEVEAGRIKGPPAITGYRIINVKKSTFGSYIIDGILYIQRPYLNEASLLDIILHEIIEAVSDHNTATKLTGELLKKPSAAIQPRSIGGNKKNSYQASISSEDESAVIAATKKLEKPVRAIVKSEGKPWQPPMWVSQTEAALEMLLGNIVKLATSAGKSYALIVATDAILSKLRKAHSNVGIFIFTPNSELAARDAKRAGAALSGLGRKAGYFTTEGSGKKSFIYENGALKEYPRNVVYRKCDVIYGIPSEFIFDYESEEFAFSSIQKAQLLREWFILIDEAHAVLGGEALTPYIISGGRVEDWKERILLRRAANKVALKVLKIEERKKKLGRSLPGKLFKKDDASRTVRLTRGGVNFIEENIPENAQNDFDLKLWQEFVQQALVAHIYYKLNRDYILRNGRLEKKDNVLIVDSKTGQARPGRRWSFGLHAAIEAKHRLSIQPETEVLTQITMPNYLHRKHILGFAGCSGTIDEALMERVYGKKVEPINSSSYANPTIIARYLHGTKRISRNATLKDILRLAEKNRTMLVKVFSPNDADYFVRRLGAKGLSGRIIRVDARNSDDISELVKRLGKEPGSIGIVTNIGGIGIDIQINQEIAEDGGLVAISSYCDEYQLDEDQFKDRAGRNNLPGEYIAHWSLEDEVFTRYPEIVEEAKGVLARRLGKGQVAQDEDIVKIINLLRDRISEQNINAIMEARKRDNLIQGMRGVYLSLKDKIIAGQLYMPDVDFY